MSNYPSQYTEFWGPSAWKLMHAISFTFGGDDGVPSEEDKKAALAFFASLGTLLPCPSCGMHFREYLKSHPVDVSSRQALARWVYDLHCAVNDNKETPSPSPTWEQVKQWYAGGEWPPLTRAQARQRGTPFFDSASSESLLGTDSQDGSRVLGLAALGAVAVAVPAYFLLRRRRDKDE